MTSSPPQHGPASPSKPRRGAKRIRSRPPGQLGEETAHTRTLRDLERAKNAAEAANEAKTRYLVAASHEIRSPLNAIYGYAQLLELGDTISGKEAGKIIRRSAEHLTNLVEGLLEISRIESGAVKVQSDVIDIRALLDHVVEMFQMQASAKGLELRLVVHDRLPDRVKTDPRRLRQILINLLSNAVKYTRDGGVTVSVRYRSQVADIQVSDTGIGIAPEDRERIFQPFDRGSLPEAQLQPGIGLGLAITRMLAQVLGGEIAVDSAPGAGSTFRLRIMLAVPNDPVVVSAQGRRVCGYEGRRRIILVVDDDAAQRTVLSALLRPIGFEVHVAENGAEGIALAERCAPDIVLLDIQMPEISGWDVASRIRSAHGAAPKIVMVTASVHAFRALDEGAPDHDAFVAKPVDLHALLALVGDLLQLQWTYEQSAIAEVGQQPLKALPGNAPAHLHRLCELAEIGHLRGLQSALDDFEQRIPEVAYLVSVLRKHLSNLDLRSFVKALRDAER